MNTYQTHQPLLFACARLAIDAGGEIIELGCGLHSTPQLEAMCAAGGTPFVSYETDERWAACLAGLARSVRVVGSYFDVPARPCAVVFIDCSPERERQSHVARFADSRLVVVHDSDPEHAGLYGLEESLALYPHRFDYARMSPNTTVVSRDGEAIRRIRGVFER